MRILKTLNFTPNSLMDQLRACEPVFIEADGLRFNIHEMAASVIRSMSERIDDLEETLQACETCGYGMLDDPMRLIYAVYIAEQAACAEAQSGPPAVKTPSQVPPTATVMATTFLPT